MHAQWTQHCKQPVIAGMFQWKVSHWGSYRDPPHQKRSPARRVTCALGARLQRGRALEAKPAESDEQKRVHALGSRSTSLGSHVAGHAGRRRGSGSEDMGQHLGSGEGWPHACMSTDTQRLINRNKAAAAQGAQARLHGAARQGSRARPVAARRCTHRARFC